MSDLPPPPPSYGTPQFSAPSPTYHLAGWGSRFGAWILDYIITMIGYFAILIVASFFGDAGALLGVLGMLVFVLGYPIYFIGSRGQTPGKMALGIKVVRDGSAAPVGYGLATGRFFATILSGLPLYLGYLWPLWDAKKQTFHDKICGTLVVHD